MITRQENPCIDFLKSFFALCIVAIHTQMLIDLEEITRWYIVHLVFRLAVPFYFVVSFYYLGEKYRQHSGGGVLGDYVKKMLPPFIFWGNIGLLFQVLDELMIGKPLVIIIIKLIRSAVFYAPGAMWFVGACIVSCLLLEKMEQNNLFNQESIEQVLLLSLLLFAFALICNTYYFLIINTPLKKVVDVYLLIAISARNGLFLFIFPLIGFLMGYTGYGTFRSQKKSIAIISCLIGFTLLIIEVTVVYGQKTRDDSSLFLALILIIPSIVSVALSCNHAFITTKNEIVWKKFRKHSVVLFFTHSPVLKILLLSGYADYGKVLFVFTFIICTIIFIATEKFGNKTTQKLLGF